MERKRRQLRNIWRRRGFNIPVALAGWFVSFKSRQRWGERLALAWIGGTHSFGCWWPSFATWFFGNGGNLFFHVHPRYTCSLLFLCLQHGFLHHRHKHRALCHGSATRWSRSRLVSARRRFLAIAGFTNRWHAQRHLRQRHSTGDDSRILRVNRRSLVARTSCSARWTRLL